VVSELYTDDDPWLGDDAVFGVKPSLMVHYDRVDDPAALAARARETPFWEMQRDLVLVPGDRTGVGSSTERETQPAGH
jgi:catechol 1,2-dioxygenase